MATDGTNGGNRRLYVDEDRLGPEQEPAKAVVYRLTNRGDHFSLSDPDPSQGYALVLGLGGNDDLSISGGRHTVLGGTGNDTINSVGSDTYLYGDSGNDRIEATGDRVSNNHLFGGAGRDTLIASGFENEVRGGSGNDMLIDQSSLYTVFGTGIAAGGRLYGGSGKDTFKLEGSGTLQVAGDTDNRVSGRDTIEGVIPEIHDLQRGETVTIGAHHRVSGAGVDLLSSVDPYPIQPPQAGERVVSLAAGDYTTFRGKVESGGHFRVDTKGGDLLLVWRPAGSTEAPSHLGSVALIGRTNLNGVTLA